MTNTTLSRLNDLWRTSLDVRRPKKYPDGTNRKALILYVRLTPNSPENIIIRDMLASRTDLSMPGAAREYLLEYTMLLHDAVLDLDFTPEEAAVVVSSLRDATLHRTTYYLIYEVVNEYVRRVQPAGVDREVLVKKLRAMDFLHTAAVVDAARRYWSLTKRDVPMLEYLEEAGLIRHEEVHSPSDD